MTQDRPWGLILRLLLAGILIALLDLAPRPHLLRLSLDTARRNLAQNNPASAFEHIALAAEQAPWRSDLLTLAGRYALQADQPVLAIQYLEEPSISSQLSPADLLLLGDAYRQAGDPLMAAAIWQRVSEIAPSAVIYQRLAEYHLQRGDYPAAVDDLRQLLQFQPEDASLNYRIGLLYTTIEPDKSFAYLSQAAELDPALRPAALELQRKIRTATLFEEPAYTFTAAGRVLATLNEWALAEAAFTRATQLRPDYAEAWAFLGETRQHTASDSPHAGLFELQQALRLDPASISANLLMGIYYERQGNPQQAINFIQETIALEPANPLLHAELGNALAQQGDLPAAQASFEAAILLAPDDAMFYRLLAEFALDHQIQVRELALPAARSAVILAPEDPRSLDLLGRTLLTLQDLLTAERLLLEALTIDPQFASAHLHLGMLFVQQGDMERGRQEFDLAETLGSGTSTATQAQRFLAYYFP